VFLESTDGHFFGRAQGGPYTETENQGQDEIIVAKYEENVKIR